MRNVIIQLLHLVVAQAQDLFVAVNMVPSAVKDVDVIIVGAGWAGMAAADSLARANVTFLVFEASNHTGGRSHAIEFGHPSIGTYVFEEGSNWVSGVGGGAAGVTKHAPSAANPVHKLAVQEGLRTIRIPGSADGNMSNYYAVFDPSGRSADPDGSLRRRANMVLDCLNRSAMHDDNVSNSVRERLNTCGWSPRTDTEWAMDWVMVDDQAGEPAISIQSIFPDETYMWWGPDDWFVIDQNPRGFARLIDGMVRDSVPEHDPRVVLNTPVNRIDWGCNGVIVSTDNGDIYTAKHAISTVSLGVLQRHHKELFSPSLPEQHADALSSDHVVMGNLTHVLVQFPRVWWDNSLPRWISANPGGKNMSGEFTEWQNLNHDSLVPGSQTLLSFLGDPQASKYQAMQDIDVQAAVVQRLRLQHPRVEIPDAVAIFISRWGMDPRFYGSYSIRQPGWRDKYMKILQQPLMACGKTVVRFAGEAMCDNLNGYTHGAYQTGKEAAAKYLYEVQKGPNPQDDDALSLCNW